MAFFGDDMFDKILREMERGGMGDFEEHPTENGRRRVSKRVFDGSSNNYIQTPKNVFLVLDLSGKNVVDVNTKKNPQTDFEEKNKYITNETRKWKSYTKWKDIDLEGKDYGAKGLINKCIEGWQEWKENNR